MQSLTDKRIFVTGANGFLGKVVCRKLTELGATVIPNTKDLTDYTIQHWLPAVDLVIHLAADVKGIRLNSRQPYRFLERNILMGLNIIQLAQTFGNIPILVASSVCAYPETAPLPFQEKDLWMGEPDLSNYGYGMAKRFLDAALISARIQSGLRYGQLISANLYGPGDNFDSRNSHVIPGLIRRFSEAKARGEESVTIWGSGNATRDFLYVDDAADAYVLMAQALIFDIVDSLTFNIGSGIELSIRDIAHRIRDEVGFLGSLIYDTSKPDGQTRRIIDSSRIANRLGWKPEVEFSEGIQRTINWYRVTA